MHEPSEHLLLHLAATSELCGNRLSDIAARVLVSDLAEYDEETVIAALKRVRHEHQGNLTLAAIVTRMKTAGGHPGAEEAWALCPKDEDTTVVTTSEIIGAWNLCKALYYSGEQVAARMAFREAYTSSIAGRQQTKAKWFISMGQDKGTHVHAVLTAIEQARLEMRHGLSLLDTEQRFEAERSLGLNPEPATNRITNLVRDALAQQE